MTIDSLNDFRDLLAGLPAPDAKAAERAKSRQGELTKPPGSLGRLEDLAVWLASWQGRERPRLDKPLTLVFAGNHGVTARGVSAFPGEVTAQMVANFTSGGAAINQLTGAFGSSLKVIPLDLDRPTADFCTAPAMSHAETAEAIKTGWNAVETDCDVLLLGEMGIGNTTAAAALCAALFGGGGGDWAGPGTGLDKKGVLGKAGGIDLGLERHRASLGDPLECLARLGGRELAAVAGAAACARQNKIPVLLDGFVATAAVAPLFKMDATALDHCVAAHVSAEPAHRRLLGRLGLDPLLDLGMRLGEASGAALGLAILQGAVATHTGMATFAEASVSGKKN